jgi:hypothetical protein
MFASDRLTLSPACQTPIPQTRHSRASAARPLEGVDPAEFLLHSSLLELWIPLSHASAVSEQPAPEQRASQDIGQIDFSKAFDLVPPWSAAYENCDLRSGPKSSYMDKGIPSGPYTESQSGRASVGGSQSNVRITARKCAGSTTVPSLRKWYLEIILSQLLGYSQMTA